MAPRRRVASLSGELRIAVAEGGSSEAAQWFAIPPDLDPDRAELLPAYVVVDGLAFVARYFGPGQASVEVGASYSEPGRSWVETYWGDPEAAFTFGSR